MSRIPLHVEILLDTIHCYDEGDGIGSAEPYLWPIYFKVDGDSVVMGDDLFLHGTATLATTPGSHGNLGDTDVDAGDDVTIPSALGDFTTTLKPIPVTDSVRQLGIDDVGGVAGVAVVLMEEDWVTDAGAEAGHVALNQFVQQAIDGLIPTLGVSHPDVTDADIAALTAQASDAVSNAVSHAQGTWHNVTSWLNGDDQIGTKVFTFSHDSLAADAFQSFSERWRNEGDWEIFGRIQGVSTCPVMATMSLLKAQGIVDDTTVRRVMEVARAFRTHAFAGRPELGAWWQLVERNTASMAGILQRDTEIAKHVGIRAILELIAAVSVNGALTEAVVGPASKVLQAFVDQGPRRLRLDAKAALAVLPQLRGRTIADAVAVLRKYPPTRRTGRAQPRIAPAI